MEKKLEGIVPIVATPFTEDGEVDDESIRTQLRHLKKIGCDGATLFGIASEYYKLSDDECEHMIGIMVEECKAIGLTSVISCTPHSTCAAIRRAKLIESAGADIMMVLPPFFLKPAGKELMDHIKAVAGAVSIPVMLQYAPEQTGVSMSPAMLRDLAKAIPNMTYFKIECKPAGPYISTLLEGTRGELHVFAGNAGYQMIETFDRGAIGAMPGSSMAELYLEIYHAYKRGELARAVALHDQLLPILNHIRQNVEMIIHYEKIILARRHIISTSYCRHPGFDADEEMDRLFETYYEPIGEILSSYGESGL